jgi:hypothetical protein
MDIGRYVYFNWVRIRPGRMEEWGLSPTEVAAINADLIYTRVSGYGQTGPLASRPGFASACEAMGGLRSVSPSYMVTVSTYGVSAVWLLPSLTLTAVSSLQLSLPPVDEYAAVFCLLLRGPVYLTCHPSLLTTENDVLREPCFLFHFFHVYWEGKVLNYIEKKGSCLENLAHLRSTGDRLPT